MASWLPADWKPTQEQKLKAKKLRAAIPETVGPTAKLLATFDDAIWIFASATCGLVAVDSTGQCLFHERELKPLPTLATIFGNCIVAATPSLSAPATVYVINLTTKARQTLQLGQIFLVPSEDGDRLQLLTAKEASKSYRNSLERVIAIGQLEWQFKPFSTWSSMTKISKLSRFDIDRDGQLTPLFEPLSLDLLGDIVDSLDHFVEPSAHQKVEASNVREFMATVVEASQQPTPPKYLGPASSASGDLETAKRFIDSQPTTSAKATAAEFCALKALENGRYEFVDSLLSEQLDNRLADAVVSGLFRGGLGRNHAAIIQWACDRQLTTIQEPEKFLTAISAAVRDGNKAQFQHFCQQVPEESILVALRNSQLIESMLYDAEELLWLFELVAGVPARETELYLGLLASTSTRRLFRHEAAASMLLPMLESENGRKTLEILCDRNLPSSLERLGSEDALLCRSFRIAAKLQLKLDVEALNRLIQAPELLRLVETSIIDAAELQRLLQLPKARATSKRQL